MSRPRGSWVADPYEARGTRHPLPHGGRGWRRCAATQVTPRDWTKCGREVDTICDHCHNPMGRVLATFWRDDWLGNRHPTRSMARSSKPYTYTWGVRSTTRG